VHFDCRQPFAWAATGRGVVRHGAALRPVAEFYALSVLISWVAWSPLVLGGVDKFHGALALSYDFGIC